MKGNIVSSRESPQMISQSNPGLVGYIVGHILSWGAELFQIVVD